MAVGASDADGAADIEATAEGAVEADTVDDVERERSGDSSLVADAAAVTFAEPVVAADCDESAEGDATVESVPIDVALAP